MPPVLALRSVKTRMEVRNIALDPAGERPGHLRTAHFCYVPIDEEGNQWERSFSLVTSGPVPFSHEGPMSEQKPGGNKCEYMYRVELEATETSTGGSSVRVISEWWLATAAGICEPVGNPLMGVYNCKYRYRGTQAPASPDRFFYGLLTGL